MVIWVTRQTWPKPVVYLYIIQIRLDYAILFQNILKDFINFYGGIWLLVLDSI